MMIVIKMDENRIFPGFKEQIALNILKKQGVITAIEIDRLYSGSHMTKRLMQKFVNYNIAKLVKPGVLQYIRNVDNFKE